MKNGIFDFKVLIESDWNLKTRTKSNSFLSASINRIRLEFKAASTRETACVVSMY